MKLTVSVPATSANLAVGFDCLGIALSLRANFTFEESKDGLLHINAAEKRFCGSDNLVWTSYKSACNTLKTQPQPLSLTIQSDIPLAGGLGSSSACVVAGIVAAQLLSGKKYDPHFTVQLASTFEGHPDNVAPAVLGGLVCSFTSEKELITLPFIPSKKLYFVAIVPPYEVRTAHAREVLPKEVALSDAVWELGRCVGMVEALKKGDTALLAAAASDKLHEPYRAKLIGDYSALKRAALTSGAAAFVISGSGATMLALCESESQAKAVTSTISAMESVAASEGQRRRIKTMILHPETQGALYRWD